MGNTEGGLGLPDYPPTNMILGRPSHVEGGREAPPTETSLSLVLPACCPIVPLWGHCPGPACPRTRLPKVGARRGDGDLSRAEVHRWGVQQPLGGPPHLLERGCRDGAPKGGGQHLGGGGLGLGAQPCDRVRAAQSLKVSLRPWPHDGWGYA